MILNVTGDTHQLTDTVKLVTHRFTEQSTMTKEDYLIILGDTGFTWKTQDLNYCLNYFNEKNFTTLFIDGNHEDFYRLNSLPIEEWNGGKVHKVTDSVLHLLRGQVFEIEGLKIFTMGGAYSIDKELRKPGINWWPQELPNKVEMEEGLINLKKHNNKVDYILTHDAPNKYLDFGYKHDIHTEDTEFKRYLEHIDNTIEFKHWYFGHHHEDIEIDFKHTVVFNKIIKLE
jgi:hypothetical protein